MKGNVDETDWKVNKMEGSAWQKNVELEEDDWANRSRSQRKTHSISFPLSLSLTVIQSDAYSGERNRIRAGMTARAHNRRGCFRRDPF